MDGHMDIAKHEWCGGGEEPPVLKTEKVAADEGNDEHRGADGISGSSYSASINPASRKTVLKREPPAEDLGFAEVDVDRFPLPEPSQPAPGFVDPLGSSADDPAPGQRQMHFIDVKREPWDPELDVDPTRVSEDPGERQFHFVDVKREPWDPEEGDPTLVSDGLGEPAGISNQDMGSASPDNKFHFSPNDLTRIKGNDNDLRTVTSIIYHKNSEDNISSEFQKGNPVDCDEHPATFSHDPNVGQHRDKIYSCHMCQSKFSCRGYLKKHIQTHTGEKPYACDICHLKFSRKENLNRHTRIHTVDKPYSCDICQLKFSQKRHFDAHVRSHEGDKPYPCDICQSKFSREGHLNIHRRIHTGEKPYACDICQSQFSDKTALTRHVRIHTGEKLFGCDICQARFSRTMDLKRHMLTHSGEKPYSCDICQLKFSRKENLNTHTRIHTGERPYSCDICQSTFSQKVQLNRHLRIHTDK